MDAVEYLKSSCPKISDRTADSFAKYCERIQTKTQRQHYAKLLGSLCASCRCDYPALREDKINKWLDERRKGRTERTFTGELAALRSLFRAMDDDLHTNIYTALRKVVSKKPPVNILTEDVPSIGDADSILDAAGGDSALYLAIVLALRCALTISDIVILKPSMFFFDEDGIAGLRFSGSSSMKRSGYIRIPDDVVPILSRYIADLPAGTGWLFPSSRGQDAHGTARWMQKRLSAACKKAGIEKKVTFRALRALSIVSMLEGGARVPDVADYVSMNEANLHYYGSVVPELKNSAVVHSRIRIVDPEERSNNNGE